jgi:hypothetical protein
MQNSTSNAKKLCFSTKEWLQECYCLMSSQKNEAMNKITMRYTPKDKTYTETMTLTSWINLAISINCVGHAMYYERLLKQMLFHHMSLTLSGLRRMLHKKEYGRMYAGLWRVKKHRQLAARTKMIDGMAKMEADKKESWGYASGRCAKEGDTESEQPAKKKARHINTLTSTQQECKCGTTDHKRVSSKNCPWKDQGLPPPMFGAWFQRLSLGRSHTTVVTTISRRTYVIWYDF